MVGLKKQRSKEYNKMRKLLDEPSVRSWRAIMDVFITVRSELEQELMKEGFHLSRFQIFFHLYFYGPLAAAELARRLIVTRGNVSTFLKRLERDNQIMVCPSSPGVKRPLYRLTPKAEKTFEKMFPQHIERVKKRVPELPAPLIKSLLKISAKTPYGNI